MNRLLVDLNDRRPVWAIPPRAVEALRGRLPPGWELQLAESPADGSGDGRPGASPEVLAGVRRAAAYVGYGIAPEIIETGTRLRWVHTATAGVGSSLHPAMRRSSVVFTNSAGIHGPPMAETVVAMLLHFFRGLDFAVAAQREARWAPDPFLAGDSPVRELARATVGILGYGGIGREVGDRVRALGARVVGLTRRPRPEHGEVRPAPLELLHGEEGFARLLAASDALVVTVPDTPSTRGLLDARRLRMLPRGAVLVNVARGRIVDECALVEVLREGHLRGAGLDVFAREPLKAESPLWSMPNVLVTPHVSGVSAGFWNRQVELITENLRRLEAGEPLLNEVDREAGY